MDRVRSVEGLLEGLSLVVERLLDGSSSVGGALT